MKGDGEFKIEDGIPIPKPRQQYPWLKMRVGQSFFVPGGKTKSLGSIDYARKKTGFKFTARTVEGGVRIWRVA